MEEEKRIDDIAQEIYTQFQNGTAFIDTLNLRRDIKRCINFEEGNQWNMDEDVADFPKITLNVIKQIGKVRKSGVLQNEYGFLVSTDEKGSIRKIQDFLKHLHEQMRIKSKDLKVINDTYKKGTGILYFYWDAESRNFLSKSGGKLKAETVDVRRFRVADPYIQDVQEQEYVINVTRERIDSIEKKYKVKNIVPDGVDYNFDTEINVLSEDVTKEFVNVYTKFYRNEEGQVHFVISTEHQLLKPPTPLNPFYKGSIEEAPNTMSTMDEKSSVVNKRLQNEVFNLYPFAVLVLEERDNCFYGIPGALEYLEAQKSINHHFSVYDKGIQDNVLGGFIYKRGILGDQEITTENGQQIELDLLPGENIQSVFGRMPVNNIPNDTLNYSGNLLGVVRQTSGASNIQIGQADHAGQSGKQTEMLLQRARENSSDISMLFNEYKKDQAYIMFLFSKFFYDNEDFSMVEHGFKEDQVRNYVGENKYNGNNFLGKDVLIDIRVGPAPSFSEFSSMELLGLMVQSGQAPFEVYLSSLPDGYVNNRQELLDLAKNNSQKTIEQLQAQLQQAQKIMQQMNEQYQKTQKDIQNIDTVVTENERLKSMIAEISAKAIEVSQQYSEENQQMTQEMANLLTIMKKSGSEVQN